MIPSEAHAPSRPLHGLLFWLLLSAFTFSAALVPIRSDNDVWWHLKSGWFISENGIPKNDVFNFKATSLEWHNHEWLSQVLYWKSFEIGEAFGIGGIRGAIVFNAVVIWLTVSGLYLLAWRISGRWVVAFLIGVAIVAIGRRMFYVRPPTITNFMLMLQLWLLVGVTSGWLRARWLLLLGPMIALWTNLHGGWMAAGVVLAAWLLEQGLAHARRWLPRLPVALPENPAPLRILAVALLLALVATVCNPYLWHLYALPGRVLTDFQLVRAIGELRSPDFYFVIDFELFVLGTLAAALLCRPTRLPLWEILIHLFFLHQAIQHVRHLSLFSVLMVPLTARLLGMALISAEVAVAEWRAAARPAVRFAPLLIASYWLMWVLINPREGGQLLGPGFPASYPGRNAQLLAQPHGYDRDRFPARVCDFVELAGIRGNVFNENYLAGYLIWRLAPDTAMVFSDSRFDIFGGDLMRLEERVVAGSDVPVTIDGETQPLWRAALRDVDWILARAGTGLWQQLMDQRGGDDAEWLPVASWTNSNLQVWIRATDESRASLAEFDGPRRLTGATLP